MLWLVKTRENKWEEKKGTNTVGGGKEPHRRGKRERGGGILGKERGVIGGQEGIRASSRKGGETGLKREGKRGGGV